ncbi:MAG: VWA domain-containing protein, partial [Burkholderiaceae bacterium]
SGAGADSVPELALHRFFESLDTPYRAYEASDTQALQHAIADVNKLEKLPIAYQDLVPRRELAPYAQGLALLAVLLLLGVRLTEIRQWAS